MQFQNTEPRQSDHSDRFYALRTNEVRVRTPVGGHASVGVEKQTTILFFSFSKTTHDSHCRLRRHTERPASHPGGRDLRARVSMAPPEAASGDRAATPTALAGRCDAQSTDQRPSMPRSAPRKLLTRTTLQIYDSTARSVPITTAVSGDPGLSLSRQLLSRDPPACVFDPSVTGFGRVHRTDEVRLRAANAIRLAPAGAPTASHDGDS